MRYGLLVICGLLLASCATQPDAAHHAADIPGFWEGMWHGLTSWITLITQLFHKHRIYAYPNQGGLYDLGFMLGCSFWFGIGYQGR